VRTLLTRLTLGLAGVVVAVLAVHLILIARSLIRANKNLAQLVGGLEAIRDNTAPLAEDLTTINSVAVTLLHRLVELDGYLQGINRLLRGPAAQPEPSTVGTAPPR
jgi:hypothetical protein